MKAKLFKYTVDLNSFIISKSEVKCKEGLSPEQLAGLGLEISFIMSEPQSPNQVTRLLEGIIKDIQTNLKELAEDVF